MQIVEELRLGGVVSHENVLRLMSNAIFSDAADFKGFVLTGLPAQKSITSINVKKGGSNLQVQNNDVEVIQTQIQNLEPSGEVKADIDINPEVQTDISTLPAQFKANDLQVLKDAIERNGHTPVLIQLHISDENLIRRRAARWVDPVTCLEYPGQQVVYSRKRRSEGYMEGEEDLTAIEEQRDMYGPKPGTESKGDAIKNPDEENGLDEDGIIGDDEIEVIPKKLWTHNLKNQMCWPIIPEVILCRLIKFPQDDPQNFRAEIDSYTKNLDEIAKFRQENFNVLNIVDLDASQHPDVVFDHLKKRMLVRGYSIYNPVIMPKKIPSLEGEFKGIADAEVIKYYATSSIEPGEPNRQLGIFKKLCPVTFFKTGDLKECDMSFAVSYKNKIYFAANENYQNMLMANPEKFVAGPFKIKKMQICIMGGPVSGKTTQSKLVAQYFGLTYISVDDIVKEALVGDVNPGSLVQTVKN